MHEYYLRTLTTRAACIATIVDPRYKDQIFTWFEESGGDGMRMHNKAMTRFKETYNRYQTRASEIDTYERLNRDEKQSKEEDGHEDDWRDPFFEFCLDM
jgi:phage regulator Rha-like protein